MPRPSRTYATLLGGSGNDAMKISTQLATGSVYNGGSGQSELDIQGSDNGDQVTINGGGLTIDGVHVNYRTGNTASGSTTITGLASASLLTVGQTVTGGGLPGNHDYLDRSQH